MTQHLGRLGGLCIWISWCGTGSLMINGVLAWFTLWVDLGRFFWSDVVNFAMILRYWLTLF